MTVETASHSCIGLKQVVIWTNWKILGPDAIWTIPFFIFSVKYTEICQRFSLFLHICSSHGKRLILLLSITWHRTFAPLIITGNLNNFNLFWTCCYLNYFFNLNMKYTDITSKKFVFLHICSSHGKRLLLHLLLLSWHRT